MNFVGRHAIHKNEEGRVFIDRNGKLFEYILDYLRNGEWDIPRDDSLVAKLNREIKYFGLEQEEIEGIEEWVFAEHPKFGIGQNMVISNNGTAADHGAGWGSVLGNLEFKNGGVYYWEIKINDMKRYAEIGTRIFFDFSHFKRNR